MTILVTSENKLLQNREVLDGFKKLKTGFCFLRIQSNLFMKSVHRKNVDFVRSKSKQFNGFRFFTVVGRVYGFISLLRMKNQLSRATQSRPSQFRLSSSSVFSGLYT